MLCDNIKTRREALGLSQQQLADRLLDHMETAGEERPVILPCR